MYTDWEGEVELSLFTDNMIILLEHLKESIKKILYKIEQ